MIPLALDVRVSIFIGQIIIRLLTTHCGRPIRAIEYAHIRDGIWGKECECDHDDDKDNRPVNKCPHVPSPFEIDTFKDKEVATCGRIFFLASE